jgi:hypothetical protein
MGEKRNAYRLLAGKPEGKRLLGRPRRRCMHNIWLYLRDVRGGDVDWIHLAQDRKRVESSFEFGIEPLYSIKCWETMKCPNNWGSLKRC